MKCDDDKRQDEQKEWLRIQLDLIMDQRIEAAMTGPLGMGELRQAVDLCRTDTILSVRQLLLTGAKPTEYRAAVQAFESLDAWLEGKGPAAGGARARSAAPADIKRVSAIIKRAREAGESNVDY